MRTPKRKQSLMTLAAAAILVPAGAVAADAARQLVMPDVAPKTAKKFEVLRTEQSVRHSSAGQSQRKFAVLKKKSRRVKASAASLAGADEFAVAGTLSGASITLATVGGQLCLQTAAGGACADPAKAASGLLSVTQQCAPGLAANATRVFGLVPDGVDRVYLKTADGLLGSSVLNNVYSFETTSHTQELHYVDTVRGLVTIDAGMSPAGQCAPAAGAPEDLE